MHSLAWWSLYVYAMNNRVESRNEVYSVIEDLLPWLNLELYQEYKKNDDKRDNTNFQNQVDDQGVDMSQFDELTSSDSQPFPDAESEQLNNLFEQQPRSMRDLFQGKLPTEDT